MDRPRWLLGAAKPDRLLGILIWVLGVSAISGCASGFAAKPLANGHLTDTLAQEYSNMTLEDVYARVHTKEDRNIEMAKLMTLSDHNYQEFRQAFYANNAKVELSLDLISLGLSTAGALATSGAAPILSGTAAAVQGAQGKFNSRFYLEKTTETLVNAMDTMRAAKKEIILQNMANKTLAQYSIEAGVRDVLEYHYGGSLISALVKIAAESGSAKAEAEQSLQETEEKLARKTTFTDDEAAQLLDSFYLPNLPDMTPNAENQAKLREWMDANGLAGQPIPMFVQGAGAFLAQKRQKAVEELELSQ